ncbi:MAG: hypothetical protein PVG99_02350 [Desulfobacteraceae bacterium]|jgi:hypothetical protein
MSEKEIGLGRLFVQEAIKAGTWGFILLLVMGIFLLSVKQDIKEGIAYSVDRVASKSMLYATNPVLIGKTKQLIKEGIEYTLTKASREAKAVLAETALYTKGEEPIEQ